MQGSGGNNAGGGGPQRPFGGYAELNQAHARVAKERTDRSVVQLEKADRTHPAEPRGSAPAVVTGNRWVEWGRAMVDQLHGRMFGRYGAAPGGTEIHTVVPSAAREAHRGHGVPEAGPASLSSPPVNRISVATVTLQERARMGGVSLTPAAGPPGAEANRAAVDYAYDRVAEAVRLRDMAARDAAAKDPASQALAATFKNAEWEVGNRHRLSPDRDIVAARPGTPAIEPPAKSTAKRVADAGKSTGDAIGVEPGD